MNRSTNNLDIFAYNSNQVSIKDLKGDVDISDDRWGFVFEFILKNTNDYYFLGERLDFVDDNLNSLIERLSEMTISESANRSEIFFKIAPSGLMFSRKSLSYVWSYYEYPALIFCGEKAEKNKLIQMCKSLVSYSEIAGSIDSIFLIHKNFEPNVLWIEKSWDMPNIQSIFDDVEK
jgi:hypothetical protein